MELKHDFVVDRPVSDTWKILTNLELIAPCLPGARLEEIEGEEYRGSVSVKVGPITGKYKGKAHFVEQDETNHVAKLKAEGRDPRQGNANALITAAMVPAGAGGDQTRVDLTTDIGLSGKIASFARGNLEDVSRRLLDQFAENLEALLAEKGDSVVADGPSGADTPPASAPSGTAAAESAPASSSGATEDVTATPAPSETAAGGAPPAPAEVLAAGAAAAEASSTGQPVNGDGEVVAASDSPTAAATTVGEAGGAESTPGSITEPGRSDQAPPLSPSSPADGPDTSTRPTVRRIDAPEAQPVDLLAVAGADTMAKKLAPVVGLAVLILLVRWLLRRRH